MPMRQAADPRLADAMRCRAGTWRGDDERANDLATAEDPDRACGEWRMADGATETMSE